jgi:hypothetical protein
MTSCDREAMEETSTRRVEPSRGFAPLSAIEAKRPSKRGRFEDEYDF